MAYMNISTAAERWNVSPRRVQELCKNGSIPGAARFGRAWMIPEDTPKPADRRVKAAAPPMPGEQTDTAPPDTAKKPADLRIAMPLLNTPYELGNVMAAIDNIKDHDTRNIALGEYHYFSGNPAKASKIVEPYLTHEDWSLRLSACWIYGYANLTLNRIPKARKAMEQVQATVRSINENTPPDSRALAACVSAGISILLHLPLPENHSHLKNYIHRMPPGLRLFILYVRAHYSYLNKQYGATIGIAETALALEDKLYPIPTIYLHLVATMGYINLKHIEQAKEHLLEAWNIAQADNMIEAFAEHHGLLGGMLEAVIKKEFPEAFAKIIAVNYSFSSGWRKIHNPDTGHEVADDLTTTEFAIAMLAARDWSNKEIAAHLGISANTVKLHISSALQKLGISQRKELSRFMLK